MIQLKCSYPYVPGILFWKLILKNLNSSFWNQALCKKESQGNLEGQGKKLQLTPMYLSL